MEERRKTKAELINELARTRQRIAEVESDNIEREQAREELKWKEVRLRDSEERHRIAIENSLEARLKALLNAIPDTMFRIDTDGVILDFKADLEGSFGPSESLVGRRITEVLHSQNGNGDILGAIRQAVESDKAQQYECVLPVRGKTQALETRIVKSGDNEAVCIVRNISDRRAAERALRESESKFRNLAEQSMVGIYLIQDGLFRYVNRQFAAVFGYTVDEVTDRKGPRDTVHPADHPGLMESIQRGASGETESLHHEFRGLRKDGEPIYVEVYGSRTSYQGRPAIIGTLLDISDRKSLERQLIQSEKMKAIGTLAGGIAHDFNNILMAIQGYTSLMVHLLDSTHVHYSKLKGIEELVASGSELTRRLLGFASGGTYETRPADLNEIVKKTTSMFARTRKEITIRSRYENDAPVVAVDSGQIEQMLLNLYVNAWQAMPGGGTLTIETEIVTLDRKFVRPFSVKAGKYAKLSVTDMGEGMDEKTKERIFEPFFTTKKQGRGTGLGLASVYNIVKGHGGIICAQSERGRGTTFHVYLPLSKKILERAESPVSQDVLKGKETILLVDDEETVIAVSKDMLEALGYSVLVATSGQEAIEVYSQNQGLVDLVILDVVMPDMGGEETLSHLRRIDESVPVMLSSGYNLDGPAAKIMEQGCRAFLQKPFTIGLISQKLREVLGKNDQSVT